MSVAVESVGVSENRVKASLQSLKASRLSNPGREAEVQSGVLKITQRTMVQRRSYGSIEQSV